ncbi:MAG: Gfo/Idh/MocA family oxidoreductase [Clostridia bacterium]|nr:Gfo/Idh/MocA family oxidoreductase [Clostridia bacterium]
MIRLGIFGLSRGWWYAIIMKKANVELVAICDVDQERIDKCKELLAPGGKAYTDFDEFIEHDGLDAVILANYFDQHVRFAVKCFERGIHVLSETISNSTMAEGVLLCRQWEKYNKINGVKYMLAENYPFMRCNLEMKHLYQSGKLGRALYCEGEYNHPSPAAYRNATTPEPNHWRVWCPPTYYCTHALGPVMHITQSMPMTVMAQTVYFPEWIEGTIRRTPEHAVMLLSMSDGSIARVQGASAWGGHGNHYRISGSRGSAENPYSTVEKVTVRYNDWHRPEGEPDTTYDPPWRVDDELDRELCNGFGHGGSDFWMIREFVNCIEKDRDPFFDVYRSVAMSSVAILGWRSAMEGKRYDIPDMSKEEERVLWENDNATPFPDENGEGNTVPCSIHPYQPQQKDIENAKKDWASKQTASLG